MQAQMKKLFLDCPFMIRKDRLLEGIIVLLVLTVVLLTGTVMVYAQSDGQKRCKNERGQTTN